MSERYKFARQTAAVGMAAAAIAGFAGKAEAQAAHENHGPEAQMFAGEQAQNPYQYAEAVLNSLNKGDIEKNIISNSAIVIPSGTSVEKAPMNALDYKIRTGNVLLLQHPRLFQKGKDLWAAVWMDRSSQMNQAGNAQAYQWVDLTTASTRPGYRVYNYSNYNPDTSDTYPFTFPVGIDKNTPNNLMVTSPSLITHFEDIAAAAQLPRADLEANLKYIGLVPAKEPVRFIKASPTPPINPPSAYKH